MLTAASRLESHRLVACPLRACADERQDLLSGAMAWMIRDIELVKRHCEGALAVKL